jgi:hypothetical protein
MYYPIPKGTEVIVQGLKCQLPPVGYGKNRRTGEIEYIGVANAELPKKEQKWKRILLPDNYSKLLSIEKQKQEEFKKTDPLNDWTDEELDKIREEHWRYRLCGYWFMNNGVPTYLTGTHWFYLNWCSSNTATGYMDYRSVDRELFYAVAHTDESPVDGGIVFVGRRQCGKTYMANAWMLDRISLAKKKHGGIQSKTAEDAGKVFNKLVNYFFDLPEFFRPTYDQSQSLRPKDTLRFFQTNIKGKNAEKLLDGVELRSWIDFGNNKSEFYDGDESMYAYILDEFGKKQLSDVKVTWETVRPCIDKEGRWFGKAFVCSTIEDLEDVGDGPKHLFFGSDNNKRNANGRTSTGLVSIFFGAQFTTFSDEYGNPLVEKGIEFHTNEMASKSGTSLTSYKRKNPFQITDAFRIDGDKCLYDADLLNDQLDVLSWKENVTTRGNFIWKNGERDTEVIWQKDRNGKWEICYLPEVNNLISKTGNYFRPMNTENFVAGADTFSHSIVKDNRRSDGAMLVKFKFSSNTDSPYNNAFVCKYRYRAKSTDIQYEDMLKTAVYFGCQILFESNKNNWKDYFIHRGYEGFLMKLKGYDDYGMPGNQKTHEELAEATEAYILDNSKKVWFKDCITDWLEFDLNNTTKFDTAMAAGYTLIADKRLFYNQKPSKLRNLSDYGFKKHKIA